MFGKVTLELDLEATPKAIDEIIRELVTNSDSVDKSMRDQLFILYELRDSITTKTKSNK